MNEDIKHPKRYNNGSGIECIDVIHALTYNLQGKEAYYIGSVGKYCYRFKEKDPIGSLQKAIECLEQEIEYLKSQNAK